MEIVKHSPTNSIICRHSVAVFSHSQEFSDLLKVTLKDYRSLYTEQLSLILLSIFKKFYCKLFRTAYEIL